MLENFLDKCPRMTRVNETFDGTCTLLGHQVFIAYIFMLHKLHIYCIFYI